ncbi:hypothetical protein HAX54_006853 [Datura stramonium]|uniref:Uncharacterized protein n=1 Tax=Datura stramonium TaxID=4076 RepID=A0ABS8WXH6_DATST|nr:hypothetical protein [Datura stramonium]
MVADLGVAEMAAVVFEVPTDVISQLFLVFCRSSDNGYFLNSGTGALNFFNGDFKVFFGDYLWVLLSTDNDTISKGNKELAQCEDGTKGNNITSNAAESREKVGKKKKKKRSEDNNIDVPDASHPENVDKFTKNTTTQEILADNKGTTKKYRKKKSKEKNGATDSKDSKKRKRLTSDENENWGVDSVETEESKCRKTEGLEELKVVVDQGKSYAICTDNGHAKNGNQEQNGEIIEANSNGNHKGELNNFDK